MLHNSIPGFADAAKSGRPQSADALCARADAVCAQTDDLCVGRRARLGAQTDALCAWADAVCPERRSLRPGRRSMRVYRSIDYAAHASDRGTDQK